MLHLVVYHDNKMCDREFESVVVWGFEWIMNIQKQYLIHKKNRHCFERKYLINFNVWADLSYEGCLCFIRPNGRGKAISFFSLFSGFLFWFMRFRCVYALGFLGFIDLKCLGWIKECLAIWKPSAAHICPVWAILGEELSIRDHE